MIRRRVRLDDAGQLVDLRYDNGQKIRYPEEVNREMKDDLQRETAECAIHRSDGPEVA